MDTEMGDTISVFKLLNEQQQEETASYTFINDGEDNALFSFNNQYLITNKNTDYATKKSYAINVLATSTSGCTYKQSFILSVFNTNVLPTWIKQNP